MISRQNALAQAALFHDRMGDSNAAALKVALERILERFSDRFGHELAALAAELQPNAALSSEQVRSVTSVGLTLGGGWVGGWC